MHRADATARTASTFVDVTPAPAREDAGYAQGWMDAVRVTRTASPIGRKADEYYAGWMDAETLQPIDPVRLAESSTRYARGCAAGAKPYELYILGGRDGE